MRRPVLWTLEAWRAEEQAYLSEVLPVIGIWPLEERETSFGANPELSIVLPATLVGGGDRHRASRHRGSSGDTVVPCR